MKNQLLKISLFAIAILFGANLQSQTPKVKPNKI
jgi:hypothetical protein